MDCKITSHLPVRTNVRIGRGAGPPSSESLESKWGQSFEPLCMFPGVTLKQEELILECVQNFPLSLDG